MKGKILWQLAAKLVAHVAPLAGIRPGLALVLGTVLALAVLLLLDRNGLKLFELYLSNQPPPLLSIPSR